MVSVDLLPLLIRELIIIGGVPFGRDRFHATLEGKVFSKAPSTKTGTGQ